MKLAAALDTSPVLARLHNSSAIAEALWAPMHRSNFVHERLAALVDAAQAGDARSLADAYYPQRRGRSLPSIATFFNVGLLADGVIVSIDELLRSGTGAEVTGSGSFGHCELEALRSLEPLAVSRCTNRSEAGYMNAAAAKAPFVLPTAGGAASGTVFECDVPGLTDAAAADIVADSVAHGPVVTTAMYTGEVAADPRLVHGAIDGRTTGLCQPADGWSCGASHGLDGRDPKLARVRMSTSFQKDQLKLLHMSIFQNDSFPVILPRLDGSSTLLPKSLACPPHASQPMSTSVLDVSQRGLPVFEDVLHLDGPFDDNYFWWLAGNLGTIVLVSEWLSVFPHAVLHFDSSAAVAWRDFHVKVRYSTPLTTARDSSATCPSTPLYCRQLTSSALILAASFSGQLSPAEFISWTRRRGGTLTRLSCSRSATLRSLLWEGQAAFSMARPPPAIGVCAAQTAAHRPRA